MGLINFFQSLPRAAKWGVYAVIGLAAYFGAVEPALGLTLKYNGQADAVESRLAVLERQLSERESNLTDLSRGIQNHGRAVAPDTVQNRGVAVRTLLRDLIAEFGNLDSWVFESTVLGFNSPDIEREFVRPGDELVRLVYTFNFEASPEDVAEVITRIEASHAVQAITSVRIRLGAQDQRILSVQLIMESWATQTRGDTR